MQQAQTLRWRHEIAKTARHSWNCVALLIGTTGMFAIFCRHDSCLTDKRQFRAERRAITVDSFRTGGGQPMWEARARLSGSSQSWLWCGIAIDLATTFSRGLMNKRRGSAGVFPRRFSVY